MGALGPADWTLGAPVVVSAWLPHFAPPRKVSTSEWAEANIVLPRATNAKYGELKLDRYQALMLDRIARPGVKVAVLMLASQTGKSLTIDALLLDRIKRDPGPVLHVSPTDGKARAFVKERLDPLVAESPKLRGMFGDGRRGGSGDSTALKLFAGGFLATASSFKADDLAARAIRYVFLDEVDRFATSAGQEGDPVLLALKRQHTYKANSLAIIASTPTDGSSRIAAWHARGDQAKFFIPCPCCSEFAAITFDRLKWKPGEPETAWLSCDACAHHLTEGDRRAALDLGEWRATAKGEDDVLSFHGNVLLSSFTTLAEVAQGAETAELRPETRRVFWNTSRAEVFEPEGFQLQPNALKARAVRVAPPYPAEIGFVTIGADLQGDRIEATVLGHGRGGQLAILNHHVFAGDTTGPGPWEALDGLMGAAFLTVDGRRLSVAHTAIDSGYQAETVYAFVSQQRAQSRRCNPVKGVAGWGRDKLKSTSRTKFGHSIFSVGVDDLKQNIMARLNMPSKGPGYIFLPDHLDEIYFRGLASEKLTERAVRGFPRREWKKERSNEPLDCLVYALAIADAVPKSIKEPSAEKKPDFNLNSIHMKA